MCFWAIKWQTIKSQVKIKRLELSTLVKILLAACAGLWNGVSKVVFYRLIPFWISIIDAFVIDDLIYGWHAICYRAHFTSLPIIPSFSFWAPVSCSMPIRMATLKWPPSASTSLESALPGCQLALWEITFPSISNAVVHRQEQISATRRQLPVWIEILKWFEGNRNYFFLDCLFL